MSLPNMGIHHIKEEVTQHYTTLHILREHQSSNHSLFMSAVTHNVISLLS